MLIVLLVGLVWMIDCVRVCAVDMGMKVMVKMEGYARSYTPRLAHVQTKDLSKTPTMM